jgi:hypothetical protein
MNATNSDADDDAFLADLLAPTPRASDRDFAYTVALHIDEAARYRAQRRRAWIGFAVDALSLAALAAGLWLLSGAPLLAPMAGDGWFRLSSPLVLVMLLWLGTKRWRFE